MQPVAPRERWLVLDVLRGFALFGVLLGNLFALYSGRWLTEVGVDPPRHLDGLDAAAQWFMWLVVDGRAQTLLTFLFGLGFAMQLVRADARGEPVLGLYIRRLVVLFAVGALHVTLLWWGDVTWGYAIAGFGLLPLRRATTRTQLSVVVACFAGVIAIHSIPGSHAALIDWLFGADSFHRINVATAAAMHGTSHVALARAQIAQGVMWTLGGSGAYFLWLLARFVIGYIAGIGKWFERDGAAHLALFRRMLVIGAALTACSVASMIAARSGAFRAFHPEWLGTVLQVVGEAGLIAQTGMYVAIVVLLLQRTRWRRWLGVLAPLGRMPLTTYIMQSVICTALYYGWGFDLPMPGEAATLAIAAVIFTAQVAFAHAWLAAFRFGPLEWVWRSLVYLERPAMRVATPSSSAAR
jgi:uncharacterized protein